MKYAILILLTASFALAQPGPFGGGMGFEGKGMCKMEAKLDLNADQQKKVETLGSEMQKKQIDLEAKVKTLRVELRDLFDSETPDQKSIEAKMTEISKMQNEMKLNHTNFWFSVNKVLTADQQKIWKESHRMCQSGMGGGREGRFGMGGGRGERFDGGRRHGNCGGRCR